MNRLTWYGHATLGLQTGGHQLVIDPFFTDNPSASTTADKVSPDFILVSHGHGDHVGDAIAIARRTGALVIANHEIVTWLGNQGLKNLHGQHFGGGDPDRRQLHHGARRRLAGGQDAAAEDGHPDPLQHLRAAQPGRPRLGQAGRGAAAGRELRILARGK